MDTKISFFPVTLMLLFISSCYDHREQDCIRGTGDPISRAYEISSFNEFVISVSADVEIVQDTEASLIIEGQENILDELHVERHGGELSIGNDNCFENIKPLKIYTSTAILKAVRLVGSGNISGEGVFAGPEFESEITGAGNISFELDVDQFSGTIAGSGNLTMIGTADEQLLNTSGSGNIACFSLAGHIGEVVISGSGNTEVNVDENLRVEIAGSGSVFYKEHPDLEIRVAGSGQVTGID